MTKPSRRELLRWASGALLSACAAPLFGASKPGFTQDPFKLGVASGDPLPDGVVLWTRLAPYPFEPDAVDQVRLPVRWQVASDDRMRHVVASGTALARPELAHSVHVEVSELKPRTDYFYQFTCGEFESPIGHTRTAPAHGIETTSARFALASCAAFADGYFAAYRDMAKQDLDFVLHVGDYIYESPYIDAVRRIPVPEARDLDGYRALHAQYKLDPDLRRAHAQAPWFAVHDDHEVANDWGGDYGPAANDTEWAARKAAAFQAYYEHMPLRLSSRPAHGEMRLYGRAVYGDLLELNLLDDRQYRDLPACLDQPRRARRWVSPATCPAIVDERRTLLGDAQEHWLQRGLGMVHCRWTVIAQHGAFAPLDLLDEDGLQLSQDGWDGYFATRQRILNTIQQRKITNAVCLGGDIHSFYAGVVNAQPLDAASTPLLTEIVGTSITAGGGGEERYRSGQRMLAQQPFAKYWDNRWRGYVLNDVNRSRWQADLRKVQDIRVTASSVDLLDRLEITSGQVGVQRG